MKIKIFLCNDVTKLTKYFSGLEDNRKRYNQRGTQHLIVIAHSDQVEESNCTIPIRVVKNLGCKSR